MSDVVIGVLGLQGAIEDHKETLSLAAENLDMDLEIRRVTLPDELDDVNGLILPGGESTAMTLIGSKNGMIDAVKSKLSSGLPAFGTCAGAILLSQKIQRNEESKVKEGVFPHLNTSILRNGYGRQRESFSVDLEIPNHADKFKGIFIRAPIIKEIGEDVDVLASIRGDPVFIRQNNLFATTFHPELANDTRIHEMFLESVTESMK